MPARSPTHLRVDDADRPLGIDAPPTLHWRLPAAAGEQVACRVLVTADAADLTPGRADWDSGRRETDRPRLTYGGPLDPTRRYHWAVRVWTPDGPTPWSESWWETGPLAPGDWDADWIRAPLAGADWQVAHLRRSFSLPAAPTRARAYVAACQRFELAANGRVAGWGQADAYPDAAYYAVVDLTDHLRAGANALGATCEWVGACQGRPAGEPGLLARVAVDCADGSEVVLTTDEGWRAREGAWLPADRRNGEIGPVERIDGRERPGGWTEPGFDADWAAPTVLGAHPTDPWERLRWQRHGVTRRSVDPVALTRLDSGAYVADFGRVYAGRPVVRFVDGTAGHRVPMRVGYRLAENGQVAADRGVQDTDLRYEYVQRDGAQRFRPTGYLGFRYLQIEAPGEPLDRERVALEARHAAGTRTRGQGGTFRSSNDALDDVWALCRHSLRYGAQEGFVDTPTREQAQFLADAFAVSEGTTRAFGERRLTRRALREFARSRERYWAGEGRLNAVYPNGDGRRDIPDFTLQYPDWVWQFYRQSGDRGLLADCFPTLDAIGAYVARHVDGRTGLVTDLAGGGVGPYQGGIVDWPLEMRYGYDVSTAARTTVNLLAVVAARRTAQVARALDRPDAAARHRERARDLAVAVDDRLTRPDGVYVDGLHADGTRSDHASQHANALALATGVVPEGRVDRVADHVAGGVAMGPMTARWLLRGLAAAGRHGAAVDCLTDRAGDGWANVLAQGGTFTWESWRARDPALDADARQNRSESHAWGAGALAPIQEELLGVRVVDPGGARIEVAPPPAGLRAAAGEVPTDRGPVAVDWEHADPGAGTAWAGLDLACSVPGNAVATVRLPAPEGCGVRVRAPDRGPVWDAGPVATPGGVRGVRRDADQVVLEVGPGDHRLELRPR